MSKKKDYKHFSRNSILVECLWILAIVVFLPAVLGGASGTFALWEILTCCGIALAVAIATVVTMILTRYRIDCDGITVNALRKSKQLVKWNEINSMEITYVRGKYVMIFVEFKSDELTILFNTNRGVMNAIKKFGKDCESFNKIFCEKLDKSEKTGSSEEYVDNEQLPEPNNTKIFLTDKERKALGGTGYHEIQYCAKDLPIKKLTYWKNITHWATDSLYIEAMTAADKYFYDYYDSIFGQFYKLDYFGINYFTKEQTQKILNDLQSKDLPGGQTLVDWLKVCVNSYNGFYFLGV